MATFFYLKKICFQQCHRYPDVFYLTKHPQSIDCWAACIIRAID